MKRLMLILIIAIPLASVIMGGVMLWAALSGDDLMPGTEAPLSKTSWRAQT